VLDSAQTLLKEPDAGERDLIDNEEARATGLDPDASGRILGGVAVFREGAFVDKGVYQVMAIVTVFKRLDGPNLQLDGVTFDDTADLSGSNWGPFTTIAQRSEELDVSNFGDRSRAFRLTATVQSADGATGNLYLDTVLVAVGKTVVGLSVLTPDAPLTRSELSTMVSRFGRFGQAA
jgi:hypothetical protein